MIDSTNRDAFHAEWDHCINSPKSEKEPEPFHKFNVPDDCAMMVGVLMAAGAGVVPKGTGLEYGPNAYDVTTFESYDTLLFGNNSIVRFFNDRRVKEKLHAPLDTLWRGCIPGAGRRRRLRNGQEQEQDPGDTLLHHYISRHLSLLEHDRPISTLPYMAELLDAEEDIRVLVYNGDRDLTTNAQGSEMLLDSMDWNGADGWPNAHRGLWVVNSTSEDIKQHHAQQETVAGYSKEHNGLIFVVVYNSGHLVPFNVPVQALDLITRFLKNESFQDYPLPSFASDRTKRTDPKMTKVGDRKSAYQPHHRYGPWTGLAAIMTLAASFVAGYFAANWRSARRQGYEEVSSHDGPKISRGVEME